MRDFKKLKIWQKGFEIAIKAYELTSSFPKSEQYGLVSQINRCAISIISNIAEGSSRASDRDYKRFVEISIGSTFELETQLIISQAIKMGEGELITELLIEIDEEQKMLFAFKRSLE